MAEIFNHQFFMRQALEEAKKAFSEDEVPVGAIIVKDNRIIARAHNQSHKLKDPTAHAEMIAITQAASLLGRQFLNDCLLYVTLEPCIMCTGALILARVAAVIYGAPEPEFGALESKLQVVKEFGAPLNVESGVLAEESIALLKDFFKRKRMINKMERWLSG